MKTILKSIVVVLGLALVVAMSHLALIEVGREVVVLWTTDTSGDRHFRRLWVVDYEGAVWLHSTGESWHRLFEEHSTVELDRNGTLEKYSAAAIPGPHPQIDRALREKYGLADRWVRFLAPDDENTLAVRLHKIGQ
ncbi:MAG: hypothetical protein KDI31_17695 [Pseudomonadales bacterium]|nr:hypothetical protein [Pseudomonadales bacterium]